MHLFKIEIPAAGTVYVEAKSAPAAKQVAFAGATVTRLSGPEARRLPAEVIVLGESMTVQHDPTVAAQTPLFAASDLPDGFTTSASFNSEFIEAAGGDA